MHIWLSDLVLSRALGVQELGVPWENSLGSVVSPPSCQGLCRVLAVTVTISDSVNPSLERVFPHFADKETRAQEGVETCGRFSSPSPN